jgi:hypothetical protein
MFRQSPKPRYGYSPAFRRQTAVFFWTNSHRGHRGHREAQNYLCALCVLRWLTVFIHLKTDRVVRMQTFCCK